MGKETLESGPIDWAVYREKYRSSLKDLSPAELQKRLQIRRSEVELYDGHYGPGNSFSNQADQDIRVLEELLRQSGS